MTTPPPDPLGPEARPPFRRSQASGWPRLSGRVLGWALGVGLLVAAVAGYLLARPRFVFTNSLAAPVRLVLGQNPPRSVAPGETIRQTVARGSSVLAQWELVRPLSADGRPMGSEIRGSIVIAKPSGTIERSARARGSDADYFAPLISNSSNDQLRIVVNAGLEGALDCGCAVRPGARRVFIGYYPLYQNSTVRARTGDGRSATFRDLGANVTNADGTLGLRFVAGDLRR